MKKKSMLEVMKKMILRELNGVPLIVILVSIVESKNQETNAVTVSIRFDVEVPKGHDEASRCRFSVKVTGNKLPIAEEELDNNDFYVTFENLGITYIDAQGNVYFRADSFTLHKERK